jgi:FkbM family methyltransferase
VRLADLSDPANLLLRILRRVRPAPLAMLLAATLGLNRRRVVQTPKGRFLLAPLSLLGEQAASQSYEPSMVAVLEHYLAPGQVFLDLGANEGYFSVIASRLVGPGGRVIAVEPQSRLWSVLATNLALNHCANARLAALAVADHCGAVTLHLAPECMSGASSLFRATRYRVPTEKVECVTLEELFRRYGLASCDLMKVDVEGSEYEILMAAGDLLRRGVIQAIALEIHNEILERRGLSGQNLHQHLLQCGYELNKDLGNWVYLWRGSPPAID